MGLLSFSLMLGQFSKSNIELSSDFVESILFDKRGGEWIETRLLASGPRTNPWFQECGPRIPENNQIIVVDTDLVGN